MQRAIAFIKRDFQIYSSYKLFFVLHWLGIIITVMTFYFFSKLLDKRISASLNGYEGGYFPFVLVGLALSGYLRTALGSFSEAIRREQMIGTLEAVLSSPTKPSTMVLCMSLWNFILSFISVIIYLLSGVFLLPLTYSAGALRDALLKGYSFIELAPTIFILLIFSLILLPLSIFTPLESPVFQHGVKYPEFTRGIKPRVNFLMEFTFNLAVKKAKKDGSLAYY